MRACGVSVVPRPHQAAETLRAMMESQLRGREDLTAALKEKCAATIATLQPVFDAGAAGTKAAAEDAATMAVD